MPFPLIPIIAGALVGRATAKPMKRVTVSGRRRKDGTRGKAHTRKTPKKRSWL
jgi:uncharacterized membrane protein